MPDDRLVHHVFVGLDTKYVIPQFEFAHPCSIHPVQSDLRHQLSPLLCRCHALACCFCTRCFCTCLMALLMIKYDFRIPGTEPLTKSKFFSGMTLITSKFWMVTRSPPIRPGNV